MMSVCFCNANVVVGAVRGRAAEDDEFGSFPGPRLSVWTGTSFSDSPTSAFYRNPVVPVSGSGCPATLLYRHHIGPEQKQIATDRSFLESETKIDASASECSVYAELFS